MAHVLVPPATLEEGGIVRQLSALSLARNAAEYIFAIPNLRDSMIPHCTPATLIRISWTCCTLYRVVHKHLTQTYDINKHLLRFVDDPIAFRSLQARTGALISGSSALQFFAQVVYEESDLDIYVKSSKVLEVGNWLMKEAGYKFKPNSTASNQLLGTSFRVAVENEDENYSNINPEGVYTFFKKVDPSLDSEGFLSDEEAQRRKVQIISAAETPMQLVLKFYSTHLMNIISYDRAYSLYPFATFEHRFGLLTKTWHGIKQAVDKYEKRGWRFGLPKSKAQDKIYSRWYNPGGHRRATAFIKLNLDGLEIPAGMLGDPCYVSTWRFDQPSKPIGNLATKSYDWSDNLEFQPVTSYTLVERGPEFANTYAIACEHVKAMMFHVRNMVRDVQRGLPRLKDDTFADDTLFRACQTTLADRQAWKLWYYNGGRKD